MNKVEKVVSSYSVKDDYVVEVVVEKEKVEFWLYKKNYGIKSFMFGLVKKDIKNEQDIIDIINANIKEHIIYYKYDFED